MTEFGIKCSSSRKASEGMHPTGLRHARNRNDQHLHTAAFAGATGCLWVGPECHVMMSVLHMNNNAGAHESSSFLL